MHSELYACTCSLSLQNLKCIYKFSKEETYLKHSQSETVLTKVCSLYCTKYIFLFSQNLKIVAWLIESLYLCEIQSAYTSLAKKCISKLYKAKTCSLYCTNLKLQHDLLSFCMQSSSISKFRNCVTIYESPFTKMNILIILW